jgi:hypothetical protein
MEATKIVYVTTLGFGYNILVDGSVIIHQDFDPDAEGDTPMSEERANQAADIVLERLS